MQSINNLDILLCFLIMNYQVEPRCIFWRIIEIIKIELFSESIEISGDDENWCPDLKSPAKSPYRMVDTWNNDWSPGKFESVD